MPMQETDSRPRVYLVEGDDGARGPLAEQLRSNGLNVGLVAISLAHVVQQLEAGWVQEFRPQVAVVGEAFVDGRGDRVQPLFRRYGLVIPSVAYTKNPVFWRDTSAFCLTPDVQLLSQKIHGVLKTSTPPPPVMNRR